MEHLPLLVADNKEISAFGPAVIGWKANGISKLLSDWVPAFFIVTVTGYQRWRDARKEEDIDVWPLDSLATQGALRRVAVPNAKILVRSSGVAEDFEARGRYESHESLATLDGLKAAAFSVWRQAAGNASTLEKAGATAECSRALLVQKAIKAFRKGHLSNERRVSQNPNDWLMEEEPLGADERSLTWRFRVKRADVPLRRGPVRCDTEKALRVQLSALACWATHKRQRMHFEWVWDGKRLWVVQCDIEVPAIGTLPGQTWLKPLMPPQIGKLNILVEAQNARGVWQKTDSLRAFHACGLPTAKIFVLEDSVTQRELMRGRIPSKLKADIVHLLQLAVVIRSEVSAAESEFPALSPRTATLSTLQEVTTFLIDQSRKFAAEGVNAGRFCYLIHHFIPARAGAFSFSKPNNPRVRIDSTWGVPDSLLAYPHDSFEFDTSAPRNIKRQLRCKSHYIYAGEDGKWIPLRCAESHDWIPSLTDSEIQKIAECSVKLSSHLKRPVEVMFFVGVDEASGHPACLPWVIQSDVPDFSDANEQFQYAGVSFLVDDEIALARARDWIPQHKSRGKVFIKLRPRLELLRSKKFVQDVANFAVEQHVPVELEGSVLSHFYYLLWKAGVQIRAVDGFKGRTQRRRFGKLVRDKIPVKISLHGETPRVFKLSKEELLPMLKAKAVEEAFELFWETDPSRILEELADLLEVVRSTCAVLGRKPEELEELAALKRKERGGFEKGLMLIETEEVPLMNTHSEISLFSGSESQTNQARMLPRNVRPPAAVHVRKDALHVSLVPPLPSGGVIHAKFSVGELEFEALVSYRNKEIQVVVRKPVQEDAPGQLFLPL